MSTGKITGKGAGKVAVNLSTEGLIQGPDESAAANLLQTTGTTILSVGVPASEGKPPLEAIQEAGTAATAITGVAAVAAPVGGILKEVTDAAGTATNIVATATSLSNAAKAGIEGMAASALSNVAGGVQGLVGNLPGLTADLPGLAGNLQGALGSLQGVAGNLPGTLGNLQEIAGNLPGMSLSAELPFFDDKAITSTVKKAADELGGAVANAVRKLVGGGSPNLEVEIASGDRLDVRSFQVVERISSLFRVDLIVLADNPSIDFDAVAGKPARFVLHASSGARSWAGLCHHIEQVRVEPSGASTYQISIVPEPWLLTQRKNYRMFQQISEPDIVLKILKEWDIEPVVRIDKSAYKKRKYRVQYGESDFAFISRMLEDAGISYYFEQDGEATKLVLADAPQTNPSRARPLMFVDDTSMTRKNSDEIVTSVRLSQRVRPGKVTLRDHDYRRPPSYKLMTSAAGGLDVESKLERYHYVPGAFLFGTEQGDATPVADDRGKTRTDEREGQLLAQKRLDAERGTARTATFETNAHDVAPGMVLGISNHPHEALQKSLLVVEGSLSGTESGGWTHHCEVRATDVPFRPEHVTPRPTVSGVESATVVGPSGEEIHTDEFGRVRVHFHWDRESQMDQSSSCWIHVSQPWGGSGYGGMNLPRIGQEVLVDFLGGDPDRPVIVGRMYTNLQKVPYKLPDNKTQSGWRSNSTGKTGGYNELMFEDSQGREQLRMQAERDMHKLVKHDESSTVGRDRTRRVTRNEDITIGKDLTKRVVENESETTGMTRTIMVGIDRSSNIGFVDSVTVGEKFEVTVVPPKEEGASDEGPQMSFAEEAEGGMCYADQPDGGGGGGGAPTSTTMTDKKIVLTTGAGATITMEGSSIRIEASTIDVIAGNLATVKGQNHLTLQGVAGDVLILGGPMVHINPE